MLKSLSSSVQLKMCFHYLEVTGMYNYEHGEYVALLYLLCQLPYTVMLYIIGGPYSEWVLIPMMGLFTVKCHYL